MIDCYDSYMNNLWVDIHEKYVIFELVWWDGQEPFMIYEPICDQMLTMLYDESMWSLWLWQRYEWCMAIDKLMIYMWVHDYVPYDYGHVRGHI